MTLTLDRPCNFFKILALGTLSATANLPLHAHAAPIGTVKPGRADAVASPADSVAVNAILNRWEPVAQQAGAHPSYWRELYGTQLNQLPAAMLNNFSLLPLGDATTAREDYAKFLQAFKHTQMSLYAQQLKSGETSYLKALGATTRDQVFIPIQPCRIVDTRNVGGPVLAGTSRNFVYYFPTGTSSWASQGGVAGTASSACPGTVLTSGGGTLGSVAPIAAVATVTAANTSAAGNLVVWGAGTSPPVTSALNWDHGGEVIANTTTIPRGTNPPGGADFSVSYNGPSGQADVIIDVVGYFVQSGATALECITQESTGPSTSDVPNGAARQIDSPFCTTGYTRTAVNCVYHNTNIVGLYLQEVAAGGFSRCLWINQTGTTLSSGDMGAQATCCRVPGQ